MRILCEPQLSPNPSKNAARAESLASQSGATGGLLRDLSRRFVKFFLASIADYLEASGSATDIGARNSHPQTLRGAVSGKRNRVCQATAGAAANP